MPVELDHALPGQFHGQHCLTESFVWLASCVTFAGFFVFFASTVQLSAVLLLLLLLLLLFMVVVVVGWGMRVCVCVLSLIHI